MKKKIISVIYFSIFTFHFMFSQTGGWFWGVFGSGGWTITGSNQNIIATDNAGNCFYTGLLTEHNVQFGAYTLTNTTSYYDIFLVKTDKLGNVLWAKQSTQSGNRGDGGYVVSTDGIGNAYITADFGDTIIFDSYMLNTQKYAGSYMEDIFLAKYDPNGNVVWAVQSQVPDGNNYLSATSLCTDTKGNTYITGFFGDTVYFGGITLSGFSNPTFFVKYDANGNVKWARQSTDNSLFGSEGEAVAINNKGNAVYLAGDFGDSVIFGSIKLNNPAVNDDTYIVKYDTNGNVLWARQGTEPAGTDWSQARGITTDKYGDVYVTGLFVDTLILGTDTLITAANDIFLVKYDSLGNVKWAMAPKILDNNIWGPASLSSDNHGDIYMSGGGGSGLNKICFGTDTLTVNDTAKYDYSSFIIKLDTSGKVLCGTLNPFGGGQWNGVASDTSGDDVYFGGFVWSEVVLNKDTLNPYFPPYLGGAPFIARWDECDRALSVNNITDNISASVKVYPNPSSGKFTIQSTVVSRQLSVKVYDVLGKQVYSTPLNLPNRGDFEIDLSNEPNGVYLYRVIDENGKLIGEGKVVVQR